MVLLFLVKINYFTTGSYSVRSKIMLDLNEIKAFTFDTGGTVLDWHSGFRKGFDLINDKLNLKEDTKKLANQFRKKSLEIVTNQKDNNLVNFDQAHRVAINEIFEEKKINIDEKDKKYLSQKIPAMLKVWDDFLDPFNILKKSFLCVSFTLLSNRLVFLNSKKNKINWDLILSCETLEVYKPNIEAYLKTAKLLQLEPKECVMVACHSFDLNAAQKAGFKTIFVKRSMEWGAGTEVSVDGEYDLVISNFNELNSIKD